MPTKSSTLPLSVAIILAATVPQFGMNIITPALPQIGTFFGVDIDTLPLLITSYLAGYAIAVLFAGIMAERYNLKTLQLWTSFLFALSSIACCYAPTMEILLGLRFIQALLGCGVTVLARLMVQRTYPSEQHIGIITALALAVAISPVIAPVIGGVLIENSTWTLLFYVLATMGILAGILVWCFVPTLPVSAQTNKVPIHSIFQQCFQSIKGSDFSLYLWSISLVSMSQIAFVSASASVMQNTLQISPKFYGLLLAIIAVGFVIGTQITRTQVPKHGLPFIYKIAGIVSALSCMLMASLTLLYPTHYLGLILPMFGIMLTVGLVVPASQAGLLRIKTHYSGYLASLFFFSQIMLSTLYGSISKLFAIGTVWQLTMFTVIPSLVFCGVIILNMKRLRQ